MAESTLSSWALLVWDELSARGLDADRIFREAGLDPSSLRNTVARYSIQQMQTLWQSAHANTGDDFGVCAGKRWSPMTFHALGLAWLASASLGEALYRMTRYGKFVNDGVCYELSSEGLQYRFSIRAVDTLGERSPPSVDASIVALLKMIRMLLGENYSPIEVQCPHPPNAASLLLEQQVRCPITFGGDAVEVLFHRPDIEKVLLTGNTELSLANEQIVVQHLSDLAQSDLTTQVELEITKQMPSGQLKEDNIARALNLSRRSMQRHLADEGTSFAQLLETKRRRLAETYLRNGALAISEIAYLLGYSEQANFTRAFKRWFGESPTQFRQMPDNAEKR